MAHDDSTLPKATLRGEYLYVEGETNPYLRDQRHTIWLRVDTLMIYRGYDAFNSTNEMALKEFLRGTARLDGDRLGVVGLGTKPGTPVRFVLLPVADNEPEFHWRARIGYQPSDGELNEDDEFWIQCYCTKRYFDELVSAVRWGNVDHIRVGMETTLWTTDASSMTGLPRTWYVAPRVDGTADKMPAVEQGRISSLLWMEKFGKQPSEASTEGVLKPQPVELPRRVYLMLSVLVALGAVLVVLLSSRR